MTRPLCKTCQFSEVSGKYFACQHESKDFLVKQGESRPRFDDEYGCKEWKEKSAKEDNQVRGEPLSSWW